MNIPEAIQDAPTAQKRWAWLRFVPPYYRSIITPVLNSQRVEGVPFIERYAQDQRGRDFLVGISECGRFAEIMITDHT